MCLGGFRLVMIVSVELNADNLTLCAESFSDLCAVFKKMNAANNTAAFRTKGKLVKLKTWSNNPINPAHQHHQASFGIAMQCDLMHTIQ